MSNRFLKWAGGKRWLVVSNRLPVPSHFDRYVEPFLGGGAVFFHLKPSNALISDVNEELIHCYRTIKEQPDELYQLMVRHHDDHSQDYYYEMRSSIPEYDLQRAARFLYLNRTCWNGLYRVNLKGEFNVPIGTKSTVVFSDDDFPEISNVLRSADIRCSDFEAIIDECNKGDFLFIDPPYTVQHNYNNFLKYNEKIFNWDDQTRLHEAVLRAVRRGVAVAATNADHSSVRNLYDGEFQYRQLMRYSVLAGEPSKRGATTEALFLANI